MALPVSNPGASTFYHSLRNTVAVLLGHAKQLQAAIAANSVLPSLVLNLLSDGTNTLAQIATIKADPAVLASVLTMYATDTGDSTDTTSMNIDASAAALQTLIGAIVADFPKAADGTHLAYETFSASGIVTMDTLTAARFPTTPTALAAWIATVS